MALLQLCCFQLAVAQAYPQDYFRSPLEIPLYLSGTFGELRGNHFHSGIDIKTNQREGQRVVAVAEGTVVRIKVSPYGFGNALYIRHPNGYTSVYGHLQHFNDQITEYVRATQYAQKSFEVDLYPEGNVFPVNKGDLIALSGNSGGSGGPHLHFEIRDSRTENIINPLLFGFEVKDSQRPDLYNLEVYEFDGPDLVSSYTLNLLNSGSGRYNLPGNDLVEVAHLPAFGITAYDRQDGYANKNGPYHIELEIGEEKYYDFRMETFAFSESRYINSHIDFSQKYCCRRNINKLYLDPNNNLSVYGVKKKMNLPELQEDSIYPVTIRVSDVANNVSTVNFRLKYTPDTLSMQPESEAPVSVFKYSQPNYYKEDNLQIALPAGGLYRDVYFEYEKKEPCGDCYSFIHELASRSIPVHEYYTIKIKPDIEYRGDKSKLVIASFRDGRRDDYEGGRWEDGYIVARTRQFGQFAIVADATAPTIRPVNFKDGSSLRGASRLSFVIDDNFSGIKSYFPTIDGEWVLFEYDAKNKLIYCNLNELGLKAGEHILELEVTDEVGNKTNRVYHLIF